jgi:uncharacterized membrane protein SpoIIM required for sporulation
MPLFIQVLTDEEQSFSSGVFALRKHPVIKLYLIFVVASFVTMLIWYLCSSASVNRVIFFEQITYLSQSKHTFFTQITGKFADNLVPAFTSIFFNNMRVLHYVFFASLIFGAGALFLLLWNASILAVAVGQKIQMLVANSNSIWTLILKLVMYLITMSFYVIFEFGAYILIAIAASIAAIAFLRHRYDSREFRIIIKDVVTLYVICIVMVLVGALLEALTLM